MQGILRFTSENWKGKCLMTQTYTGSNDKCKIQDIGFLRCVGGGQDWSITSGLLLQ